MFNIGDTVKVITNEPGFTGKIGTITEVKRMRIGTQLKNRYLVNADGLSGALRVAGMSQGHPIRKIIPNGRYYYREHLKLIKKAIKR